MRSKFAKVKAQDACRTVRPQIGEGDYTAEMPSNLLHEKFNPPEKGKPHGAPNCLDYVFVKQSGGGLELRPGRARVIRDWTYETKPGVIADLSDHYPVTVTFQVATQAVRDQPKSLGASPFQQTHNGHPTDIQHH